MKTLMRGLGGTYETWRVERPGAGLAGAAANHASEVGRATIPADHTLANTGTIADLECTVVNHANRLIVAAPP